MSVNNILKHRKIGDLELHWSVLPYMKEEETVVHEHPSGHPSTSQNKVFVNKAAVIIQENIAQLMNLLTC
jgi:DNA repair protein RadC